MVSDHNGLKVDIAKSKICENPQIFGLREYSALLNTCGSKHRSRACERLFGTECEPNITYNDSRDTAKPVLRCKFIALKSLY